VCLVNRTSLNIARVYFFARGKSDAGRETSGMLFYHVGGW
jgi:hypothetical protein